MIDFIIGVVLTIVMADALFVRARIKLRTRATKRTTQRRPGRSMGPEGWRGIEDLDGGDEATQIEDNPFAGLGGIVSNNARRESPRRGAIRR